MGLYSVRRTVYPGVRLTRRVRAVMGMFGLDMDRLRRGQHVCDCEVRVGSGEICYITGPSGSGKSVLIREMYEKTAAEERLWLDEVELDRRRSLIDCIEGDVCSALRMLCQAGLGDAFAALSRPAELSEGQKYRYRLARALAGGARVVFADEFCSNLDRITAAVIAHRVACIARQSGRTFVLASSHDDLLCDLRPDVIVAKRLGGGDEVIYKR